MKPNHSNSDNLKGRIEQILNKVSLYASDWYDDDNDDGLNEEEATAQLLQIVEKERQEAYKKGYIDGGLKK